MKHPPDLPSALDEGGSNEGRSPGSDDGRFEGRPLGLLDEDGSDEGRSLGFDDGEHVPPLNLCCGDERRLDKGKRVPLGNLRRRDKGRLTMGVSSVTTP